MKSKKIRLTAIAVILIIMAIIITSCQPAETTKPISTTTSGNSTTSTTAPTTVQSNVPEYLNTGTEMPIVKEGNDITISVVVAGNVQFGDPKKVWFWEYVKREMNIKTEVEVTLENNTYVSLAFASKNLPDLLLCYLSNQDIVKYGQDENQLLAFNEYLNNDYMPNLSKLFAENPDWMTLIQTDDEKIYSAPKITDTKTITGVNITGTSNFMINQKWLQQANKQAPATLVELLDVLRAFKDIDEKYIPLGGAYESVSPGYIILNALGYTGTDAKGFQVCLRDGNVVFPFGDREVFGEYLKYMNQLYSENLISEDYFTLDETAVKAQLADGKVGIYPASAGVALSDLGNYKDYWGSKPLTSDYNQTIKWKQNSNGITIGACSISSESEYPETICRFIDWFYEENSTNYLLAWIGPSANDKDMLYDMISGYDFDVAKGARNYIDVANGKFGGAGECVMGSVAGFSERFGYAVNKSYAGYALAGHADKFNELVYNDENVVQGWHWDLYSIQENLMPYLSVEYPHIQFFSQEDNTEISDLKTMLESYATQEIARFIIGEREPTDAEINKYFDTLKSMGFEDYLKYYSDYYVAKNK